MNSVKRWMIVGTVLLLTAVCLGWLHAEAAKATVAPEDDDLFGYGVNIAKWDISRLQAMGFNWVKVFNAPGSRLPVNVLLRVDVTAATNPSTFANELTALANGQKEYVDAYEIGNEVNLDASYGWAAPPEADKYTALLCDAYGIIKTADSSAIVVAAGLAPTGRVTGSWEGHVGHNGLFQDEREYLREMLAAGAGECFDVMGYHPYGYAADFDAEPDGPSCTNGFCFRGVEKIYEILVEAGYGNRRVWGTEFGWIVAPPDHCLSEPGWSGRSWQIVNEQKQAENLVGSYTYAAENYPWLDALFLFNFNFNVASWYTECEQMRFYSVQGRPAEQALTDMPKLPAAQNATLRVSPVSVGVVSLASEPLSQTRTISLHNDGTTPFSYTVSVSQTSSVTLTLPVTMGMVNGGETAVLTFAAEAPTSAVGLSTALLTISAGEGTANAPQTIPVNIHRWETIRQSYLPFVHAD